MFVAMYDTKYFQHNDLWYYSPSVTDPIGVRGRAVKIIDVETLTSRRCGFESRQGPSTLSCVEAIQLA